MKNNINYDQKIKKMIHKKGLNEIIDTLQNDIMDEYITYPSNKDENNKKYIFDFIDQINNTCITYSFSKNHSDIVLATQKQVITKSKKIENTVNILINLQEKFLNAINYNFTKYSHTKQKRMKPSFQILTCIDEREESFRRHIEEVEPTAETFAVPGHFGFVMFFKGPNDVHYRPLGPAGVVPVKYVEEVIDLSFS